MQDLIAKLESVQESLNYANFKLATILEELQKDIIPENIEYYSIEEIAEMYDIHRNTVAIWVSKGLLKPDKKEKCKYLFSSTQLENFKIPRRNKVIKKIEINSAGLARSINQSSADNSISKMEKNAVRHAPISS